MNNLLTLKARGSQSMTLMVLASAILISPIAHSDELQPFQPQALIEAEDALAQGNPQRAMALLHRQRAMLSHQVFNDRVESIACQAHLQLGELPDAEQSCDGSAIYIGNDAIASIDTPAED